MDIELKLADKPVSNEDSLKRKNPQLVLTTDVKRSKKHPSPSKEDLDGMVLSMKNFPLENPQQPPVVNATALSTKDVNGKVKPAKRVAQGKVAFAKQELTNTAGSIPNLGAKGLKSAMRKPTSEKGSSRPYYSQHNLVDESMIDLDELQVRLILP
jgi:hypothetical protein